MPKINLYAYVIEITQVIGPVAKIRDSEDSDWHCLVNILYLL